MDAGRDLALKGANIDAGSADVEVGRNLTVESQLDTAKGSNSSKGANAGVTVGLGTGGPTLGANAGANMAKGWQSRAWVDNPSGILTDDELNVSVGENTSLTGGVIASRSGDLTLETETLETKDLELHDKNRQVSASANVSLGRSADGNFTPGGSIEGSYSNYEKEGIARATIGEGEIVVRDGDADGVSATKLRAEADAAEAAGDADTAATLRAMADAEEAEDKAATDTQLANLNRDPDNVVEVTKVTDEGFELYVSDTSVTEALNAGKTVAQFIGDVIEKLVADNRMSVEDARAAKFLTEHANDPDVLAQLEACGQQRGDVGPGLFDWLITPAYASAGCRIDTDDGVIVISPELAKDCAKIFKAATAAAARVAISALAVSGLAATFLLASTVETGGAIDETQTLPDGTVIRVTGHGSDVSRSITVTQPNGVELDLTVEYTGNGYQLTGGTIGGMPMSSDDLRSVASQINSDGIPVVYNENRGVGDNGGPPMDEEDEPTPPVVPIVPGATDDGGGPDPTTNLPTVGKAVNSNIGHAIDRGVERGVFRNTSEARSAYRKLTNDISKSGWPNGTIKDPSYSDRYLVPIGNNGYAAYQLGKNGTAKLKTTLNKR